MAFNTPLMKLVHVSHVRSFKSIDKTNLAQYVRTSHFFVMSRMKVLSKRPFPKIYEIVFVSRDRVPNRNAYPLTWIFFDEIFRLGS